MDSLEKIFNLLRNLADKGQLTTEIFSYVLYSDHNISEKLVLEFRTEFTRSEYIDILSKMPENFDEKVREDLVGISVNPAYWIHD